MEITRMANYVDLFTVVMIFFGLVLFVLIIVLIKILRKNTRYSEHLLSKGSESLERSRLLTRVKLEIQEETMHYVSKELHDNFGHSLALINMELKNLEDKVAPSLKEDIEEVSMMVLKLKSDVRNIFESLRSVQGKSGFLSETLGAELARIKKTGRFQTTFQLKGEEVYFAPEHQVVIFRMFQEILHNVLKHSQADSVDVKMSFSDSNFTLSVTDNGKGFEKNKIIGNGMGLKNLEERAQLISAKVHIISRLEKGTTVQIIIPKEKLDA